MRLFALIVIAALLPITAQAVCLGDANAEPLKVYIVPQLTATQTYTRWAPLLEKIGQRSKHCFKLIVPASIPQFETDLNNGLPDFAFMNPYHMVMKWGVHQYIPLVASSVPIFGVLSVRRDSQINNLIDLKNLSDIKIAFPAPNAFAASLLIRATLTQEKVDFQPIYLKTHSNVYRSVIRGDVAAGGGIQSTLLSEPAELQSELRVLMETKRYTAHPFAAHARISPALQRRIQRAFLEVDTTSEGRQLLRGVQLTDPQVVTFQKNYQPLEALQLEKFVVRNAN